MKTIINSNNVHNQYYELIEMRYGKSANTLKYISDTKNGLDTIKNNGFQSLFLHYVEDERLIGHIGLLCTSKEIAYFGFFELTDINCFSELWQALIKEAKQLGIKNIFGPVNGTVWHPYRVIIESSDEPFFAQEPLSSVDYYNLFKMSSPSNIIEYHSAYRTNFDLILEQTRSSLSVLQTEGIQIIQENLSPNLLREIYELSTAIFSHNPGYYQLSFNDFLKLYSDNGIEKPKHLVYKVLHNNKPIGFSYNVLIDRCLIMKTIGLLPAWQEKGIGNAIVHEVHKFAHQNQMQKVIYSLIRKDNRVKHFPNEDAVIFRKYASFIFNLS